MAETGKTRFFRASRQSTGVPLGPLFITIQISGSCGSTPHTAVLFRTAKGTTIETLIVHIWLGIWAGRTRSTPTHTRPGRAEEPCAPSWEKSWEHSRAKKRKLPPSLVVFFRNECGPPAYRQNPSPPVIARRHTARCKTASGRHPHPFTRTPCHGPRSPQPVTVSSCIPVASSTARVLRAMPVTAAFSSCL